MPEPTTTSDAFEIWVRRLVGIMGIALLVVPYLFWMIMLLPYSFDDKAGAILQAHYPAVIGLPAAAGVSYILVVFLRQSEGPIEISGPGFTLKGAAGPVVLWALCFFVITWAIKEVWSVGGP
jgi:hypothetical protein